MAAKLDPTTAITDPHGITWVCTPSAGVTMTFPRLANGTPSTSCSTTWPPLASVAPRLPAGTRPKEEVKTKADAAGLKIVAQWFSSFIVRDGIDAVIPEFRATCEYLQFLGATRVVVSEQTGSVQGIRDICIFENKPVLTEEEWPVLAEGRTSLARSLTSTAWTWSTTTTWAPWYRPRKKPSSCLS